MSEYIVTIEDQKKEINIFNNGHVLIDGQKKNYELIKFDQSNFLLRVDDRFFETRIKKIDTEFYEISVNQSNFKVSIRTALQEKAFKLISESQSGHTHLTTVKSPMPGLVLKIKKGEGETVSKGDSIIILEAMKMENEIKSPTNGIMKSINVTEGLAVEKNSILFTIE
jgi:biotin carboxyl carrier protein